MAAKLEESTRIAAALFSFGAYESQLGMKGMCIFIHVQVRAGIKHGCKLRAAMRFEPRKDAQSVLFIHVKKRAARNLLHSTRRIDL